MTNWQQYLPLIYPLVTALASLIYPVLDKTTWGHAAFSFLASLGLDLPKVWGALIRLLPGATGSNARADMKVTTQ